MPDEPYTLTDLASLADVTPRTVRYYVAQGLLPSPDAAGPATRYGEGHLARLRLIKRLQREHLPLAEIRGRLERMGDPEVQQMLDATPESAQPAPAETLAFVRGLMAKSGVQPRVAETRATYRQSEGTFERTVPDGFPLRTESMPAPSPSLPAPMPATPPSPSSTPMPRTNVGSRTTWEHLVLAPDVELHVRRPLDRTANKRVEQLIRIARELFDDEP
jgi:DNA-binding transcriptional MerR regulator